MSTIQKTIVFRLHNSLKSVIFQWYVNCPSLIRPNYSTYLPDSLSTVARWLLTSSSGNTGTPRFSTILLPSTARSPGSWIELRSCLDNWTGNLSFDLFLKVPLMWQLKILPSFTRAASYPRLTALNSLTRFLGFIPGNSEAVIFLINSESGSNRIQYIQPLRFRRKIQVW